MNHAKAELMDDAFEVWIEARERVSLALRSCFEARGDEVWSRACNELDRARAAEKRAEKLFFGLRDSGGSSPEAFDCAVH